MGWEVWEGKLGGCVCAFFLCCCVMFSGSLLHKTHIDCSIAQKAKLLHCTTVLCSCTWGGGGSTAPEQMGSGGVPCCTHTILQVKTRR